jgi:hypothetical protein
VNKRNPIVYGLMVCVPIWTLGCVLINLGAVLTEAGMDYTDVVSVTVFMDEMDNFDQINQVYAE